MNTALRSEYTPHFSPAYISKMPREEKLILISLLADSLREEKATAPEKSLEALCASFGNDWNDVDAEQLRSSRIFNRTVETC